jgi:hypothetical protein
MAPLFAEETNRSAARLPDDPAAKSLMEDLK